MNWSWMIEIEGVRKATEKTAAAAAAKSKRKFQRNSTIVTSDAVIVALSEHRDVGQSIFVNLIRILLWDEAQTLSIRTIHYKRFRSVEISKQLLCESMNIHDWINSTKSFLLGASIEWTAFQNNRHLRCRVWIYRKRSPLILDVLTSTINTKRNETHKILNKIAKIAKIALFGCRTNERKKT